MKARYKAVFLLFWVFCKKANSLILAKEKNEIINFTLFTAVTWTNQKGKTKKVRIYGFFQPKPLDC